LNRVNNTTWGARPAGQNCQRRNRRTGHPSRGLWLPEPVAGEKGKKRSVEEKNASRKVREGYRKVTTVGKESKDREPSQEVVEEQWVASYLESVEKTGRRFKRGAPSKQGAS